MTWSAAGIAHLATRVGNHFEHLVWLRPVSLVDGSPYSFGIWTGATNRTLNVEGASRTYLGGQAGIQVPDVQYEKGLSVQVEEFRLGVSAEVETLVRGYYLADAPFEYHVALYHPRTRQLIDIARRWRGFVDSVSLISGEEGGQSYLSISASTKNMVGTTTVPGGRSHEDQKRRSPSDTFLQDASLGRVASDPWGGKA